MGSKTSHSEMSDCDAHDNESNRKETTVSQAIHVLNVLPSPQDFYETYVHRRKPVVFKKSWSQLQGKSQVRIPTLDTLASIVDSKAIVEANQRLDCMTSFSPQHSKVVQLEFGDFVSKLKSTSPSFYMTTQTLPVNDEGRPELHTTPMTELIEASHCILRPSILGNLIPVTYNLWIGATAPNTETSSGLHHDYHDNLYCIWDGCKTLQLAPPEFIGKGVITQGTLLKLHDNGRIVYEEQVRNDRGMIRPDGALEEIEIILQLQIRQQDLERQLDKDPDNQELEEMLERVQDELLDLERDDASSDEGNILFNGRAVDDFDDDDEDTDDSIQDSSASFGNDVRESSSQDEPGAKKRKLDSPSKQELPLNFATNSPVDVVFETVLLEKGDLLYLPAGWFHNVTSKGNDDSGGVHMAMNYWMHPPDTSGTFERPYVSEFWPRDWEARFNS